MCRGGRAAYCASPGVLWETLPMPRGMVLSRARRAVVMGLSGATDVIVLGSFVIK